MNDGKPPFPSWNFLQHAEISPFLLKRLWRVLLKQIACGFFFPFCVRSQASKVINVPFVSWILKEFGFNHSSREDTQAILETLVCFCTAP